MNNTEESDRLLKLAAWIRTPGNVDPQDAIDQCARLLENNAAALAAAQGESFDDEPLPPRGRGNVERKQHLAKCKDIKCSYCKYHRGENRNPHQGRRNDRYKNHRS